jgi:hypothetical protein
MAAILKLRRGSSIPTLTESELFYHTSLDTLVVGDGTNSHILLKSGSNTVNLVDISGTISASYIHVANDLTIKGNIILGDEIANDNITINAELSGSLIPDADNRHDLGSNSKKYRNLYVVSASIDDITLNSSNIVSSSAQVIDLLPNGTVSGSSQITITESQISDLSHYTDSDVKTKLNTETVISGSSQVDVTQTTNYSSINQYTDSDNLSYINGLGVISGSIQVNADSITNFDSNVKDKLNVEGVISSSAQIEGNFLEINGDSVVSSSAQISGYNKFLEINGDSVVSGSSQINSLFGGTAVSTSLDSRIVSLESDTHTHSNKTNLDTINQNLATTNNVTFADGDFTGDVQINGSLVVQGSATELQVTELRVEDKLITVASGSSDSAAADGAGIEIGGANKSLTWNHGTTSFVLDAKVSSSVGFKGEGGELTGIDTDQVTEATNLYYTDTRVKTKLNTETVISGSTQVNADSITNFDSNVKDKLNDDGVISGSSQITITESQISDLDHYTDSDVKTKLNTETVISGSSQVNADSITNFDSNVKDKLNVETVVSSSAQVISSLPSGLVSGSSFSSTVQGTVRATINGANTDVDTGLLTTDSPTFQGITLNNLSALGAGNQTTLISGSGGIIGKRTLGTAAFFNVSSSIGDDPNSIPTTKAVNDALISAGAGDITEVNPTNTFSPDNTGLVHLSSGTDVGGVRGVQGNIHIAVDTGSAHFQSGVELYLDGTYSDSDNTAHLNSLGVISGSSQITITESQISDLDHYTNSDWDTQLATKSTSNLSEGTNLYYTDVRVKTKLNTETVVSGSSQIDIHNTDGYVANEHIDHSTITIGSGKGLTGGGTIDTNRSLSLDTGSVHFQEGVELYSSDLVLPAGIVSGSSQIDVTATTNYSSINQYSDSKVKTKLTAENVVSSSAQISNYNTFLEIEGNGVVSSSLQINSLFSGTAVSTSLDSRIVSLEGDIHTHSNKSNLDSINQNLANNDNVQFADLVLTGNLEVQGTTTTLNTEELTIEDKLLSVASGSTTTSAADGGGFHISGANASITWDDGNSRLVVNKNTHFTGTLQATGDIVAFASSDERLKDDIQPIKNPLDKINSISGNSFIWNEDKQDIYKGKDYGVIAQEIEKVLPELVRENEWGYKAVKYDKLVSLLIEGIKELSTEVNKLKNKNGE